jgi:Spy/CpxP family protein refolding chaperone
MARHIAWFVIVALWAPAAQAATCERPQAGQGAKPQQQQPTQSQPQSQSQQASTSKDGQPQRWKWWLNPDDRKELGITDQQSRDIDAIFESIAPKQREAWRLFDEQEDLLSKMVKDSTADWTVVAQLSEKVERLRADINKTHTVMLYRINLLLTPEQRIKVKELRDRREEARKKQGDKGGRRNQ